MAMSTVGKQWTRVRTLHARGVEVFLAADDASGELFAVKSAAGAPCAAALRRERCVMATLSSPRIVSCIGGRGAGDGSYQLFLEFAPGGSLAEQVASNGGLDERSVRGYASAWRLGSPTCTQLGWSTGRQVKERRHRRRARQASRISVLEEGALTCRSSAARGVHGAGGGAWRGAGPQPRVWALRCMVVEMATAVPVERH
ncbi:hypothetical protein ZWY2020_044569 [Hordeum vulgare]|nr:hypothetical protein ZWY2020_044569 [Hordeum vulgare]